MVVEALTHPSLQSSGKAKVYNRIKLSFGIASSLVSFLLLVLLMASGYAIRLAQWARSVSPHPYGALLVFAAAVGLLQFALTSPFGFYTSFVIEHRYGLSNQSFGPWLWERFKGLLVGLPLGLIVLCVLYYCLREYSDLWWLPVSAVLTMISVVLARLAPVIIMPLFYTFTPIGEGSLRERIMRLCRAAGLRIEGIYSFNLSKNTKKANAGFTGIGKSKRIILGDTLVESFSEEEIETVFAHELGHYKHRHIITGMVIGTVSTFVGLSITAALYSRSVALFGLSSLADLAGLPLLGIWLVLFGLVTTPIGKLISRRHERQADRYAVVNTGNRVAFISALLKLASMNLADPEPHPVVEFLFYSHPSIARRIRAVEALAAP